MLHNKAYCDNIITTVIILCGGLPRLNELCSMILIYVYPNIVLLQSFRI